MKLLILGGTRFLGRHLVDAALVAGHEVTLFNRGRTAPNLFPAVESLRGERDGGLDALRGRRWDAVIDTCGYVPRVVRQSAQLLAEAATRYIFVSSVSVYADLSGPGVDEDAPVARLYDPATEDILPNYGGLKAACEEIVREAFGPRALVVRPGLIVGPFDPSWRFSYWVERIARGGRVLAPDVPDYPVQFIDARDLAQWMVMLAERGVTGTLNAAGPAEQFTLAQHLALCARMLAERGEVIWVPPSFLAQHGIEPWTDMPLWAGDESSGVGEISIARAVAHGLALRPVEETVLDTWRWIQEAKPAATGLSADREQQVLAAWAQHHGAA